MQMLKVRHITRYRYARPVRFGEHRMMLRPRDDPDQSLLSEALRITPEPDAVRIERDAFGNFVAVAAFSGASNELCFDSEVLVARATARQPLPPPLPGLRPFPLLSPGVALDLPSWASGFAGGRGQAGLGAIAAMNAHIHRDFAYRRRLEPGVQTPEQTLALRSGACRDFAILLVEAARCLGLQSRFVSGYVHCPEPDDQPQRLGGGHTHAWAQVLTPEAGWIDFDPTSGRTGPDGLVRVALAEDPRDACPIQGVFHGDAGDFLSMHVEVDVSAAERFAQSTPACEPLPLRGVG
jgi:transglutaminase-like putative cysteine protease